MSFEFIFKLNLSLAARECKFQVSCRSMTESHFPLSANSNSHVSWRDMVILHFSFINWWYFSTSKTAKRWVRSWLFSIFPIRFLFSIFLRSNCPAFGRTCILLYSDIYRVNFFLKPDRSLIWRPLFRLTSNLSLYPPIFVFFLTFATFFHFTFFFIFFNKF